jgi:hypothetical protein
VACAVAVGAHALRTSTSAAALKRTIHVGSFVFM